MASVLNAKKVGLDPPDAPYSKPSKIPVRTEHSSGGSASDDSDNSSKSESKSKTGGKSHLPVPVVKPPTKKVVHSSKPAGTSGSDSDPEKNSNKGVEETVVPATEKSNTKSEDNDTGAEPIKKTPARLKSLKLKRSSSVNQARCVNPLSRSVMPGINKKQTPVKTSSDALAFVQQGRLRPARKFQAKKANDLPEEEQEKPSGGIGRKTSFRNIHSADPKDKPGKKVENSGLKDRKKISSSKSNETNSPRTRTKSKTTSKAATTKKRSDRKSKGSDDSESDNSLGLKPIKHQFQYETESDDLISTDSEPPCAPKEAQSTTDPVQECPPHVPTQHEKESDRKSKGSGDSESDNSLGLKPIKHQFQYETESDDLISTDSEPPCAPKEAQSTTDPVQECPPHVPTQHEKESDRKSKELNDPESDNSLGLKPIKHQFQYETESDDLISTDSEPPCAPKEAESKKEEVSDNFWLLNRKFEYEEGSDFFSPDSEQECRPKENQGIPRDVSNQLKKEMGSKDDSYNDDDEASDESSSEHWSDSFWAIGVKKASKLEHATSDKSKDPVKKKALMREITGQKNKIDSVDEDSFIEELDELLSSAEADIEEASKKDEASDASGDYFVPYKPGSKGSDSTEKETSALDNDVADTPVLQQTESDAMMAEPVQDLCVQSLLVGCDYQGMVTASNETSTTSGKPSGSEKDQPSGESGGNRQEVAGGSSRGQGSSVGGSGDGDDPNDPKKPKPRKEPEDKKGEDDDQHEKERTAKKALDKQTLEDDLGEPSLQTKAAVLEAKASQTKEEESVEALKKTIRSKDKEIALRQNLVDCCRKDYEELQESFNQYTNDFKEVDENRAKIGILTNENNILKQENSKLKNKVSQKTSEASQAQERSKKLKNMLSKMEVDLDFLETEKKELLAKLKLYEANAPQEKDGVQTEDRKDQTEKDRLEHGLGRSCSLQDVEAMKAEEENVELKNKLHQCEASIKTQKKECSDFKEKIAKLTKKEDQWKSRIQRLTQENDVLNSKCSQLVRQWKEASIGEKIEDLRKLQCELSEAGKELETDGTRDCELKATSSPLSVELAEADTISGTQQVEASQSSELQTLIHSLAAMTEELREGIKKTKAKIAKAYSENDNGELVKKYEDLVKQLNEEIASLKEKLEDDAAKFQQMGCIIECSNTERERLDEQIEELEKELCKAEDNLTQTTTYKDRELNNLRHDIEMKELKVDELVGELRTLLEGNDLLRTALNARDLKLDKIEGKEKDLKNYIDELELENETLLKELSEQKLKLLDVRRENIEKEKIPREEFENLQNALKNKIDSMTDVINDVEEIKANNPFVEDHPCTLAIDSAIQILYDISGLLKAIGYASLKDIGSSCSSNDQVPGPSTGGEPEMEGGESRFKELESMIDDLKEQLKNLKEENQRLEKKVKEKRVRFAEDTKGGEADAILRLREQLQERETQLEEMEEQMIGLQAENDTLTDYLGEVRDKAVRDTEALRCQTEMHLNQIQELQADCENQRLSAKNLKGELSECNEKNATLDKKLKDVAVEKQDLEQKLEAVKDNESFRRQTEIHLNHMQKLQADCENQRRIVKSLKGEMSELKDKNATLDKRAKDLTMEKEVLEQKLETDKDAESFRRQTEIHLNHMQKLQEDCENQRRIVKSLKGEMSELKDKNATLDKRVKDLIMEKEVLEQKLETDKDAESFRRQTEIHLNHMQKLQEDCENQRRCVKSLKGEMSELKDKKATLDKRVKDLTMEKEVIEQELEAVQDSAESFRRQIDIHLNHMQKLQRDCENQRRIVNSLKGELSELNNKNATLVKELKEGAAEKQALEQKLKAFSQEGAGVKGVNTAKGEETVSVSPSTSAESDARIKELQVFNEELNEKLDMYQAFFEQVKDDKVQTMKAIEASRQNAMMLKNKSDEQITELEKKIEDKNVLETKLQDTVTSLEKRISTLEAEKLESENQVKAMVESMQGQNELEKCKKEWKEMEVELRNSILALTTEKSEAQKELEEQKSVVAKASESLEIRMKELDECLQDRQALQEELACLKSIHSKQKEELAEKMKQMGQDVDEREAEVKLVRHSSSEIIDELEKQLKDRRDSEIELKERAEALSQQIDRLEAEKIESDKKIQALMESIDAQELENEAKFKRLDEGTDLKEKLSSMEVKISELATEKQNAEEKGQHDIMLVRKESEEKITALEKRLQDQSDSETMLQEKVHSLEFRISQLNGEKAEIDDNMKTLIEAMDANKNLEEQLKKKEQLERELASKVEEMKLKLSRIRSTKNHLEHQLVKKQSELVSSSTKSKRHSKELQDDLDECVEREKELNERLKRLTEDSRKAEERESQARLAKKSSDEKIRVLEKEMLSKGQSEQDLKERMAMLEEKISRLEVEKSQHCKNISSIIRKLKTKEDLADAITARDEAERKYKIKIDEMEIIVNKLRKERSKADCDVELKERYREEYEESRRNVRTLTENVNRCNERVKELQSFVSGSVEDDESLEIQKPNLHKNIEDLKRSLKVSDVELFKKLQSLNEKITHLEDEKAEGEKMITAMLKSMEDKEKMEHCIATSREADKKMIERMDEMGEAIKKLRIEKKRVENELQKSEKLRAAKECESELLQSQTDEKISSLQQSLKERYESEWEIQKRLEAMSEKLAQMESAKEQADKTIQTMLESLQWKDNLEYCLEEKDKIEKELKRRVQELKLESKEALMEAKKYQVQCRDAHKMKEQILSLKEQLLKMECDKEMALENMKELLQHKVQQMECDTDNAIESMKELLQQKEEQLLQMECDKDRAIEGMKELLQQKEEQLLQMERDKENMKDLFQQKVQQMECDKEKTIESMKKLLQLKEEQLLQMECVKDRALENTKELIQQKEEQLLQMECDKDRVLENMKKLLQQKEEQLLQMECDKDRALENMKKLLQQKVKQMECDKDMAIESMKELLHQKGEQLKLVEKTLKEEVFKLKLEKKDLKIEAKKSQIQTRDAFELIKKQSHEFDECLVERNESSERMMAEMENLKESLSLTIAERDELENKAKKYAKLSEERQEEVDKTVHREVELLQKLSDAQKEIEELQGEKRGSEKELIQTRMEASDTVNSYKEKIKKLCETLKLQSDQEKDLRHIIDSLRKQTEALEDEKENAIQEGRKVIENLNMELGVQSRREMELNEQLGIFEDEINQLRKVIRDLAKREEELREENSIEIRKNRESARVEKEKLLLEIEELNNDKSSSTRASRKLVSELRNSENELLEKIDELKLNIKTLEGDKRRISMEYKDYQSDVVHMTETSRDANKRMHEEIITLRDNYNNLNSQLREMKLKESCLLKDKEVLEQQNEENERIYSKMKDKSHKQKTEITRLVDREGELKNEIIDLRSKISVAEDTVKRVRDKAEHRSEENRLMCEARHANARIAELQLQVIKKCKAENRLKDHIDELKDQISKLNRAVESEQLDKVEITNKHNITKGHIIEFENSIEKKDQEIKHLDRSIEELRAQVLRLQHEKQQISNSLENCQKFLNHSDVEVHLLERKLGDQEALLTTCKRNHVELTNLRTEMKTNSLILESRLDLIRVRQFQENNII